MLQKSLKHFFVYQSDLGINLRANRPVRCPIYLEISSIFLVETLLLF